MERERGQQWRAMEDCSTDEQLRQETLCHRQWTDEYVERSSSSSMIGLHSDSYDLLLLLYFIFLLLLICRSVSHLVARSWAFPPVLYKSLIYLRWRHQWRHHQQVAHRSHHRPQVGCIHAHKNNKKTEPSQRWPRDAPDILVWVLWKISRVPEYAHGYFSKKFWWAFLSIDAMNMSTEIIKSTKLRS